MSRWTGEEMASASESDSIEELARDFHHHDEGLDGIFDVYRQLRQGCPVGYSQRYDGFYFATRYEDIYRIEQDPQSFCVAPTMLIPPFGNRRPMIPIDIDPPMHAKYRKILLPMFSPQQIDKVEPRVREVANRLIDALGDRTECDASYEYARPLPMIVFCQMMGLPDEEYERFQDWVERIIYVRTHDFGDAERAADEVYTFFTDLLEARRREPYRDDLIGRLLSGEIDGRPLSEEELLDYCFLLFLAGLETTAWTIRSGMWHLAQHPEDRAKLVRQPELVSVAVEEILRCFSPAQAMGRTATKDGVEVGAQKLKKGDRVLILFGSGNRDEEEFPMADEVIIDRQPNRHLAFGGGIHRCLGSNLGRREVKVALEEFLRRIPDFRIADGANPAWHGIGPLPLKLDRV